MARIVILGAGLGGIPTALKMKELARAEDQITVINKTDKYTFIPSNPWVAVGWRRPDQVEIPLAGMFQKRGIEFIASAAEKILPETSQIELVDGRTISFDYLIIAVGPDLAFDEIPGLGPETGHTHSICQTDHAAGDHEAWRKFVQRPGRSAIRFRSLLSPPNPISATWDWGVWETPRGCWNLSSGNMTSSGSAIAGSMELPKNRSKSASSTKKDRSENSMNCPTLFP
ncbi:MAG: FAD-dependent oxidoreductase [Desulfosarcinaceae bacterium]